MRYLLPVHFSVTVWLDTNMLPSLSRNNLPWCQHFSFPFPCLALLAPLNLLFLVADYEKGNRFTAATSNRKISQGLASRHFLKMKNNLGPMPSHLCTYNKCEFKHEFKILGIGFGGWWCLISHPLQFTWPNTCNLKMKGETHTEIFFHELCFKELASIT